MLSKRTIALLAVVTGVALETGVHLLSGRREAWDSAQYWTIGLPIAAIIAALLGFLGQDTGWRWTVLIIPAQVLTMMIRTEEVGNLWPLALILAAIMSLPFVAVSWAGAAIRRAVQSHQ